MVSLFSKAALEKALRDASLSHHNYEEIILHGVRDKYWSGWYAAYVLGRLGDFTSPSELSSLLETISADDDWFLAATDQIYMKFNTK